MAVKKYFKRINKYLWEAPASFSPRTRAPARVYASEGIFADVEERALEQLLNTASLPGIVKYAIAMPDIHSGYGPPIGGVGAFKEGVISPGFVGFDENCGVRLLKSGCASKEIEPYLPELAERIQKNIPSGLGRERDSKMSLKEIDSILEGGAAYLIKKGYGQEEDSEYCEEKGRMENADTSFVSEQAKKRGRGQVGTLGSGNHFCEIQKVEEIFDKEKADIFGLFKGQIVIMVHTGSRGLGHQNCTDYLKTAKKAMEKYNLKVPDKELACLPFDSPEGRRFSKALAAACNYAWANRQMITYYLRQAWASVIGKGGLSMLYDVAHNIAKIEKHRIDGKEAELIVHRKGATRAFPPRPPRDSRKIQRYRTAGLDSRHHGHILLCLVRNREVKRGLAYCLPWSGENYVEASGEKRGGRKRAG